MKWSLLFLAQRKLTVEEYHKLKPAIALLRKQKDYFDEEENKTVSILFEHSPKLKLAYKFSRDLSSIFDSHIAPEAAKEKMKSWIYDVTKSKLKCFNAFINTLNKYFDEITNYFSKRDNSGFVEGFNNNIKVLKRRCYGLSNIKSMFKRLILDTTGMCLFAPSVIAR